MRSGHTLSRPLSQGAAHNPDHLAHTRHDALPLEPPPLEPRLSATTLRAWWTLARERVVTPVPGASSEWYRTFRRWSPGIVPPLLGALLLLLAFGIGTRHIGPWSPLVGPHTLMLLFVVYVVCGTLFGLLLYFITDVTGWWAVLTGGLAVYLIATCGVIGGPLVGVIAAILVGALAARYAQTHWQRVPDGKLVITEFAGDYHRALQPGRNVLIPGERVQATLDTGERRFTCPTQRARVFDEARATYIARAAATVAYNVMPREAYRVARSAERWERDLHELVCVALEQALSHWGTQMLATEGNVPERLLGRTVLLRLREEARTRGIHIIWVSVRDIWLAPEGETLPVDEWADGGRVPHDETQVPAGHGAVAAPPPLRAARGTGDDVSVPAMPAAGEHGAASEQDAQEEDVLAADVLSDAYEAVRDGRILDPVTIREVAQAFLRVADDETLNAEFPYDALTAAHHLLDRAKQLERGTPQTHATAHDGG